MRKKVLTLICICTMLFGNVNPVMAGMMLENDDVIKEVIKINDEKEEMPVDNTDTGEESSTMSQNELENDNSNENAQSDIVEYTTPVEEESWEESTGAEGDIIAQGTCKSPSGDVHWVISGNGVFTLSGTGTYTWDRSNSDWWDNKEEIKSVFIEDGITAIAEETFFECYNLENVRFPSDIKSIGSKAFYRCQSIKEISLPDTVEWAGSSAFEECTALQKVKLSKSMTAVSMMAFENCYSLKEIVWPDNLARIGSRAFFNTGFEVLSLPEGILSIDSMAISGSDLHEVYIPSSLSEINGDSFGNTIKNYHVSEGNKNICDIEGVLYSLDEKTLLLYPCGRKDKTYTVNEGTTNINCKFSSYLEEVILPESVKVINTKAFYWCLALKKINLPSNLEKIGDAAFDGCSSLEEIVIPGTVKRIGTVAFRGCHSLKKLIIQNGACSIDQGAFANCNKLEDVVLGEGLSAISGGVFSGCNSLKRITVPGSVKEVGQSSFADCTSLEKVIFEDGIVSINNSAFLNDVNINEIHIPYTLKYIGAGNFNGDGVINTVYYAGSKKQWDKIEIEDGVTKLFQWYKDSLS